MKSLISAILCSLPILLFGQLVFEEITIPNDFSVSTMRQSPNGEFFMQAKDQREEIYTSFDGINWTQAPLPGTLTLSNIQFYDDGTPVLLRGSPISTNAIRRDGVWFEMELANGVEIETAFVKEDSLFTYDNNIFLYSLDKGETFTTLFEDQAIGYERDIRLWKFDNHLVFLNNEKLTIYNTGGEKIMEENFPFSSGIYNTCGEIFFTDIFTNYAVLRENLDLEQGILDDMRPTFNSRNFMSKGGNYYCRNHQNIYKTVGCNFDWQVMASGSEVENNYTYQVNEQEDILLFRNGTDSYLQQLNGSNSWVEQEFTIGFPHVLKYDESDDGDRCVLTPNHVFTNSVNTDWSSGFDFENVYSSSQWDIQYSENGNLYLNFEDELLFSQDNGLTFNSIDLPVNFFGIPFNTNFVQVLEDSILVVADYSNLFYSLNHGVDWIEIDVYLDFYKPIIKKVGDYIYIVPEQPLGDFALTKINLLTNEVTSEQISFIMPSAVIMTDEGVVYTTLALDYSEPTMVYKYESGIGLELVEDLYPSPHLFTSRNQIFGFSGRSYFQHNNVNTQIYQHVGLPSDLFRLAALWGLELASNNHLYYIHEDNRVFRSTTPLTTGRTISGTVYNNLNQDCVEDATNQGLQYWKITAEGANFLQVSTTNHHGNYSFDVPAGDYTISAQLVSPYWSLCESSYEISIAENDVNIEQNFQAKGTETCSQLAIDISTPFLRRCFENYYSVRVHNTGPEASQSTKVTLQLDPYFDLLSTTIPHMELSDGQLEFDLGLLDVNENSIFRIYFTVSCDAEIGIEHCLTANLTDTNICDNGNADAMECQVNIGSFDPNDKRVFNEAGNETAVVDTSEFIHYHIRFQNTGTDTAFSVIVVDQISEKLDITSLEMLSASHDYEFRITDGANLEVMFNDIMLPDSVVNEVDSHGFFKFKIKPLEEFGYGTEISNQAAIYFDFNDAIITNNVLTTISLPISTSTKEPVSLIDFEIFPNPTDANILLNISQNDLDKIASYGIMNNLGQMVDSKILNNDATIEVAQLPQGVYTLILKGNEAILGAKKFVKF